MACAACPCTMASRTDSSSKIIMMLSSLKSAILSNTSVVRSGKGPRALDGRASKKVRAAILAMSRCWKFKKKSQGLKSIQQKLPAGLERKKPGPPLLKSREGHRPDEASIRNPGIWLVNPMLAIPLCSLFRYEMLRTSLVDQAAYLGKYLGREIRLRFTPSCSSSRPPVPRTGSPHPPSLASRPHSSRLVLHSRLSSRITVWFVTSMVGSWGACARLP